MKAVLIEDEEDIADIIRICLSLRWPECETYATGRGKDGIRLIGLHSPDVVILDLSLADGQGLDFLKEIRAFSGAPVLIVSAKSDELTKVKGLEMGADDFIVKPFSHTELLARILAVMRRSRFAMTPENEEIIQTDRLRIDFSTGRVHMDEREVELSAIEWKFLRYLSLNERKIIPVETIVHNVWGLSYVENSAVKTCVRRLRLKLGDDTRPPKIIRSYRGRGYSLELPAGAVRT